MSELHNMALAVINERAAWTADPVLHLRTGTTITAEIDGSPDALTVATELGEDYRNVILLHVTNDAEAALLNPQDLVQFRLFGNVTTCKVLKRRDSGGQAQTDFWVQQSALSDQ
jgi:hypothetical protein